MKSEKNTVKVLVTFSQFLIIIYEILFSLEMSAFHDFFLGILEMLICKPF